MKPTGCHLFWSSWKWSKWKQATEDSLEMETLKVGTEANQWRQANRFVSSSGKTVEWNEQKISINCPNGDLWNAFIHFFHRRRLRVWMNFFVALKRKFGWTYRSPVFTQITLFHHLHCRRSCERLGPTSKVEFITWWAFHRMQISSQWVMGPLSARLKGKTVH